MRTLTITLGLIGFVLGYGLLATAELSPLPEVAGGLALAGMLCMLGGCGCVTFAFLKRA